MTVIAVLGASFVSIISSKQEGVGYVLKGQQAKMIAKAGVEWAIRYVSDGLSDESSTYYTNLPAQPATNKSFGDGADIRRKCVFNFSDSDCVFLNKFLK